MKCPTCSENFDQIAHHWAWYPDHQPEVSYRQKELLKGILMSDASVKENSKNPYLSLEMKNIEFVRELANELGWLSNEVYIRERETNMGSVETGRFQTKSIDYMKKLRDWYSSGEKEFPSDLKLTKTKFALWYLGDGDAERINSKNRSPRIRIGTKTKDKEKLTNIIETIPVEVEYNIRARPDVSDFYIIRFTVDSSMALWKWMEKFKSFESKYPKQVIENETLSEN